MKKFFIIILSLICAFAVMFTACFETGNQGSSNGEQNNSGQEEDNNNDDGNDDNNDNNGDENGDKVPGMTDEEIANHAINAIKALYAASSFETPIDYKVIGKAKIQDVLYDVNWSVSAENNDISDYIKVGTMDEEYRVTISVTQPPVAMEYTLTASVTVGEKTASCEFTKIVPAAPDVGTGDNNNNDDDDVEPPHECEYSDDWSSDENNHWRASICPEHPENITDQAPHNYVNGKCKVCDRVQVLGVGDSILDFTVATYNSSYKDGIFSSVDARGKVLVLNFWYVSCAPCIEELPFIEEINNKFGDDVVVVALHANDQDQPYAQTFINNRGWSDWKTIFAKDIDADYYFTMFGGKGVYPLTVVINGDGIITEMILGKVCGQEDKLTPALKAILGEDAGENNDDDIEPPHVCTYSQYWSCNTNYHWHISTCPEHPENIDSYAPHSYVNGRCSECKVSSSSTYRVGDRFLDFNIDTFNRTTNFSSESARGKVIVLNFWYVNCGPCVDEMPEMENVKNAYGDQVEILALHATSSEYQGDLAVAPTFIQAKGWSDYNVIFGKDNTNDYLYKKVSGATGHPVTVVINGEGIITAIKNGTLFPYIGWTLDKEDKLSPLIEAALKS